MPHGDEKSTSREMPVACRLSDTELRKREATLLAEFIKRAVTSTEEFQNGHALNVRNDKKSMLLIAGLTSTRKVVSVMQSTWPIIKLP